MPKKKASKRYVGTQLDASEHKAFAELAEKQKRSLSNLAQIAISELLQKEGKIKRQV